jgi:hypothetical protein
VACTTLRASSSRLDFFHSSKYKSSIALMRRRKFQASSPVNLASRPGAGSESEVEEEEKSEPPGPAGPAPPAAVVAAVVNPRPAVEITLQWEDEIRNVDQEE